MERVVEDILTDAQMVLNRLRENKTQIANIAKAGKLLATAFKSGGKAYSCGNGGSMCDAMHFAEELSGRFRNDRPGLGATAISDPSHLSCVGNDYGYNEVFSRFLQAHGRGGDVLLAISTSGSSKNILRAAEEAKKLGMKIIALTGKEQNPIGDLADVHVCTMGTKYADRVQELHIKVIHTLIEIVEREMFPANYEG